MNAEEVAVNRRGFLKRALIAACAAVSPLSFRRVPRFVECGFRTRVIELVNSAGESHPVEQRYCVAVYDDGTEIPVSHEWIPGLDELAELPLRV